MTIRIAKNWGMGVATKQFTPIINRLIDTYGISPVRAAPILAAVHAGINDVLVVTWYYKFRWNVARPNQLDPNLATILCTHRHPSYVSGHSTVAGCAKIILSYFFPAESSHLKALVEECARSRLYAGVHFPIDNEEGLRIVVDTRCSEHVNLRLYNAMLKNEHLSAMIVDPYRTEIPKNLKPFNYKCEFD